MDLVNLMKAIFIPTAVVVISNNSSESCKVLAEEIMDVLRTSLGDIQAVALYNAQRGAHDKKRLDRRAKEKVQKVSYHLATTIPFSLP